MKSLVAGLSLAACVGLIACGGSPSSPSPSPSSSGTTASTPAPTPTPTPAPTPTPTPATTAPDGTILLEGLPLNLGALDYTAIVARREGRESDWVPVDDFGRIFPITSARPTAQANPQPTFYAPYGTPVLAVVSGTVTAIPTLYSNDFSVMIGSGGQGGVWEHEHVINVTVRVGDRVTAGQQIAEVSNFECVWGRNNQASDPFCQSRLGLVEIGLLYGGGSGPPQHRCPFDQEVVSPAKRDGIFEQLNSARARIKTAFGDPNKYRESTWATPQCVTLARVEG